MTDLLEIVVVIGGVAFVIMVVLPLVTFFACLWELRYVWPYAPLEGPSEATTNASFDPANPYAASGTASVLLAPTEKAAKANETAQSLGFRYLSAWRHAGSSLIEARYDVWISGEHEVLALVAGGKVATVPVECVCLYTQLAGGPMLVTITSRTAAEQDLSPMTSEMLLDRASFAQALHSHLERLRQQSLPAINYSDDPIGDLYQFRVARCEDLWQRGYIRYLDPDRNTFKATLKGAFVFAFRSHYRGLLPRR